MIHVKSVLERVTPFGAAVALLAASTVPTLMLMKTASADPLTERSLTVSSTVANDDLLAPDGTTYTGLAAGDPRNGQKVTHEYEFNAAKAGDIEGFTIEYCETAFGFVGAGACASSALNGLTGTSPAFTNGFSASAWDDAILTIENVSQTESRDFSIEANAANYLTLTLGSEEEDGLPVNAGDTIAMTFTASDTEFFVNPRSDYKNNDSKGTYFAHIQTFAVKANAAGAFGNAADTPPGVVDDGTVTNNITTGIGIYTRVQETLNFSVEGEQNATPNGPSVDPGATCAPLTESGQIKMGDTNHALSSSHAYDAYSYFRLSTNSSNGVTVAYSGDTLKNGSGTLDINPLATKTTSAPGSEQFGLAIDNTATGTYPVNVGNGGALQIDTAYNAGNGLAGLEGETAPFAAQFTFDTASVSIPRTIASTTSPSGVVNCDTGAVRYIANISPDTPAGIYQTKINYIASPKY